MADSLEEKQPTALQAIVGLFRKVILGAGALIFLIGDRVLREICHFSFGLSLMIWAVALGVIFLAWVLLSGLDPSQ